MLYWYSWSLKLCYICISDDPSPFVQVYIRIRDHEWNVYRRYSQFLELHQARRSIFINIVAFHILAASAPLLCPFT